VESSFSSLAKQSASYFTDCIFITRDRKYLTDWWKLIEVVDIVAKFGDLEHPSDDF
jgi:hypothetical protein